MSGRYVAGLEKPYTVHVGHYRGVGFIRFLPGYGLHGPGADQHRVDPSQLQVVVGTHPIGSCGLHHHCAAALLHQSLAEVFHTRSAVLHILQDDGLFIVADDSGCAALFVYIQPTTLPQPQGCCFLRIIHLILFRFFHLIRHIYGVYRFTSHGMGGLTLILGRGNGSGIVQPHRCELLFVVKPHRGVLQELGTDVRLHDGLEAPVNDGVLPKPPQRHVRPNLPPLPPPKRKTKVFSSHDYMIIVRHIGDFGQLSIIRS